MRDFASSRMKAEGAEDTAMVPTGLAEKHPDAFFCLVDGAGMSNVVPNGALVLIDPAIKPENGSVAAVEVDGKPYLRRWFMGSDTLLLTADGSEDREDMVFSGDRLDDIALLGKVVWYQPSDDTL